MVWCTRVFGSLVRVLRKLEATVRVAAPATLLPTEVEKFGVEVFHDVETALAGVDVIYTLRVQQNAQPDLFLRCVSTQKRLAFLNVVLPLRTRLRY